MNLHVINLVFVVPTIDQSTGETITMEQAQATLMDAFSGPEIEAIQKEYGVTIAEITGSATVDIEEYLAMKEEANAEDHS